VISRAGCELKLVSLQLRAFFASVVLSWTTFTNQ